ncbi:AI-2E family transporter [Cryomorpha ignava]|uniref:AI-2E family transporter n=1 Tax=Cryomorpha ignava TaxID=101383 RepID=A0A7K3WN86_9FLAO|nr:AI-2E family transporter [Cryomorpha ignava]NEN23096.1 AI-2E family transporter [Cryomorpha ignava]
MLYFLYLIFFLKDKNTIRKLVLAISPMRMEKAVDQIFVNTNKILSRYFLGLLVQIVAITTCVYIGLSIVGVQNALLIATFTGIANLVPYLGPWIGASFGAFILLANNIAYSFSDVVGPKMLGLVLVFTITQLLDNYIFQPAIFSNSIKAHPLEIFLVILIACSLGGILGMVAALPVYSFLRIVFTEMNREFSWLDSIKSRK